MIAEVLKINIRVYFQLSLEEEFIELGRANIMFKIPHATIFSMEYHRLQLVVPYCYWMFPYGSCWMDITAYLLTFLLPNCWGLIFLILYHYILHKLLQTRHSSF